MPTDTQANLAEKFTVVCSPESPITCEAEWDVGKPPCPDCKGTGYLYPFRVKCPCLDLSGNVLCEGCRSHLNAERFGNWHKDDCDCHGFGYVFHCGLNTVDDVALAKSWDIDISILPGESGDRVEIATPQPEGRMLGLIRTWDSLRGVEAIQSALLKAWEVEDVV